MHKKFLLFGTFSFLAAQTLQAHDHHRTYIVEEAPPVVVIAQPAPVTVISVESEPPVDLVEEMSPSPGEMYAWQKGHWQWNGSWNWVRGCWIVRPATGGVYVPGYWKKSHHHWEWVESHWK